MADEVVGGTNTLVLKRWRSRLLDRLTLLLAISLFEFAEADEPLRYAPTDPDLKVVLIDSDPTESLQTATIRSSSRARRSSSSANATRQS